MIPENEEILYRNALDRIGLWIAVVGVTGTVLLAIFQNFRFALGFLAGSAISWFGFRRWRAIASALGGGKPPTGTTRPALRLAVRLALMAAVLYGMLRYLEVNLVAVVLGLLAAAAAVVIEIIYLLFHRGV